MARHPAPAAGEQPKALLLTGAFGTGKSTVAEEIADILEAGGRPFAAIDLDWLCWANVPGAAHDDHALLVSNLAAVVANYRASGVRLFVLAGSIADVAALDAIRDAVQAPIFVVRVTAPLSIIAERLRGSPTRARADDLQRAEAWLATGAGDGLEHVSVANTGSVRDTAHRVLTLAGW